MKTTNGQNAQLIPRAQVCGMTLVSSCASGRWSQSWRFTGPRRKGRGYPRGLRVYRQLKCSSELPSDPRSFGLIALPPVPSLKYHWALSSFTANHRAGDDQHHWHQDRGHQDCRQGHVTAGAVGAHGGRTGCRARSVVYHWRGGGKGWSWGHCKKHTE